MYSSARKDAIFSGASSILLRPDLFQPLSKASLFPVRDLGQDIPHEVDLAALPGRAQPLLLHRGLDAPAGV